MSVLGVDPGIHGALAHWFYKANSLNVTPMPLRLTYKMGRRGGKKTQIRSHTIDIVALFNYFDVAKMCGCELVVIEDVAGRPGQANMFQFGWSTGLVHAAAIHARIPIERAHPALWKRIMGVPGKATVMKTLDSIDAKRMSDKELSRAADKAAVAAILARAENEFPDHRHMFRGKLNGINNGACEAALIAKFGARNLLMIADGRMSDEQYKEFYKGRDEE